MTTPNPALVAAAPILSAALTDVKQAITTILTGDPAQIGLRVAPAIAILDGQLTLLFPDLASAEETVIETDVTSGLDSLITRLNALGSSSGSTAGTASESSGSTAAAT